ncbi:uncharacterized protein LOC101758211 isoform X1 [Setaria italica]|uniref:uncharacterized protein LOC101758211 isoform X1 n=1 Tax=Setaria italica TaxID=4555 RepID=UPI000350AA26|nr:uncharacterized protein LOC101758211 isoform X1 [Setaria italica]
MFSGDWTPPCGSCCTKKYASLVQIPWRVFCKKGCNADGDTWEQCIGKCTEICYKDPVLEDRQWSAYIDRSPGQDSYSLECFNACVSGCGFRVHTKYPRAPYLFFCLLLLGLCIDYYYAHQKPKQSSGAVALQFEVPTEKVEEIKPNRPSKPSPPPEVKRTTSPPDSTVGSREDVPCTSA